jgi:hypothetical protein
VNGIFFSIEKTCAGAYRYGFNGQEKSTEINENSYTAEFWQYDSRIGRRWNVDPVLKVWESPYAAFANNPIWFKDVDGADTTINGQRITDDKTLSSVRVSAKTKVTKNETKAIDNSTKPFNNRDEMWYGGNRDYSIRKNNVTFWQLYKEFRDGTGPTNSAFGGDHPLTNKVKNDILEVDRLRFLVYSKYDGILKPGNSFTNFAPYNKRFLPWKDNLSSAPQFIGTFSGDVFVSEDGKSLVFVISDSKSTTSLFYRAAQEHDRVPEPWNYDPSIFDDCLNCKGNTYQKYTWTEPINYEWFKKQDRDSDGHLKTKYGPEH